MPEIILSDYFYGDESEEFVYFKIPRQLITNPQFREAPKNKGKSSAVQESQGRVVVLDGRQPACILRLALPSLPFCSLFLGTALEGAEHADHAFETAENMKKVSAF